jgi:hypothetical protein
MASNLWCCFIPKGSQKPETSQATKVRRDDKLLDIDDLKKSVCNSHQKLKGVDPDELVVYDCHGEVCDPQKLLAEFEENGTGTEDKPFVISYPATPAAQGTAPSALHLVCCIRHLDGFLAGWHVCRNG